MTGVCLGVDATDYPSLARNFDSCRRTNLVRGGQTVAVAILEARRLRVT